VRVDDHFGDVLDGAGEFTLARLAEHAVAAERNGFDGVWAPEVSHDAFLPLVIAAERSSTLQLGTSVAVAFARNPMTMAVVANDLNTLSGGRFVLGLGSQIQAHIERRFSMPWSAPARRMREYIAALQAIWHSWYTGDKLDFRGEFYQHTLMTPMFRPARNAFGPPTVMLAAVGPKMTSVAAEVADGLLAHGFTTARYMREATIPLVMAGLAASGRERSQFTVSCPGLVVTGSTEAERAEADARVRAQLAFYGSTPAYRPVLDLHGWGDLHVELNRLSKAGEWDAMASLIDDEVLNTFAVVGEPDAVGKEVVARFGDLVDRFSLYAPYPITDTVKAAVVSGIKAAV
jgi:probable F420-dependent oxidoreductase